MLGEPHREQGVHHRVMGDEDGVVDGVFLMRVGVGDDRRESGFAARTGSGGDGDQRGEFLHDAQDAFHLGDGFAGTGDACADALCAVHGRAAAESDDDVALVVVVELETLFDVGDGGVGDDLVIDGDVQPFRLEAVDDGLRHAEAHEPLVGDEQRALPALLFRKGGEFCEAALAGDLLRDAPGQEEHGDVHHLLKTSAIQFVKCIHCC